MVQDVIPILGQDGALIALFSIEISLIQLERHRSRHASFRQAIEWLKAMCMRGELVSTERLSPFTEWDGVLLVDPQRRITYLSGIANNLYRRLGYLEDLRGKRLSLPQHQGRRDGGGQLWTSRMPLEAETQEGSRIWVRKVLPVWGQAPGGCRRSILRRHGTHQTMSRCADHGPRRDRGAPEEAGAKVKTTMIQEVHHRVKNNLQTVAAMLRMQARRTEDRRRCRPSTKRSPVS